MSLRRTEDESSAYCANICICNRDRDQESLLQNSQIFMTLPHKEYSTATHAITIGSRSNAQCRKTVGNCKPDRSRCRADCLDKNDLSANSVVRFGF